ncbi:MAG TPA: trypsin-like peptidase domain-containing protein, partial [Burkholderiaceae bacterium]|nr:trypsin-like peptidase domain-containing protein [Burkholderiaceae bacterium]
RYLYLGLASASIATGMFLAAAPAAHEAVVPRSVAPRPPLTGNESNVVALFENTAPSVAYIYIERQQRINFFTIGTAKGAGSGFVWDTAGHVVTNYHVVENASSVQVQLDSGKPIAARVVGIAPEYDLAVVQLKDVPKDLRPIPLGSSHDLKIGQSVYAIGNPFGLSRTLTTGIVSALDRSLPTSDYAEIDGVIQTDAAINPGNSGGPLLDSAGRLIGVNSAIRSESGNSAGVGFAIPSDMVNRVVPRLIATGRAPRPGIGIVPADPLQVARAGISGVVIQGISHGSPAEQAGFKVLDRRTGEVGDVIVGVDGRRIDTLATFVAELDHVGIGNIAELTVNRDGSERRVRIKVVDVPR